MTTVRHWPGMRSEHSRIPAGADPTRTEPNQVGVSFSDHRAAVFESDGRTTRSDIHTGAVFVTGRDPITWTSVHETSEALEIYPDLDLLGTLAPARPEIELAAVARDGTVLAVASILRRVHRTGSDLSDLAASTLAHRLAGHLLDNYCGLPRKSVPRKGLLGRATVDLVTQYIESELDSELTLDRLAGLARLSPFHFARAFKATTGLAPHQFVMARRMDRAMALLRGSTASVVDVAHAVGLCNVSHFRRVFRAHTGLLPGEVRKFRPSPGRAEMPSSHP